MSVAGTVTQARVGYGVKAVSTLILTVGPQASATTTREERLELGEIDQIDVGVHVQVA